MKKTKNLKKTKTDSSTKIASEFAIGVIVFVAVIMGGIFWLNNVREKSVADTPKNESAKKEEVAVKTEEKKQETGTSQACKPRYFEGEQQVEGWLVSTEKDGVVIALKIADILKFPTEIRLADDKKATSFNVKLIDPTEEFLSKMKTSSEKKQTQFSIRGYAEACQQMPLVSIKPAGSAFKK